MRHLSRRALFGATVAASAAMVTSQLRFAAGARATEGTDHAIAISDFEFNPATLSVKPGDRITWTNTDIAPHTATALDGSWDTGELTLGQSRTLIVGEQFASDYFCQFHPSMTAELIVGKR